MVPESVSNPFIEASPFKSHIGSNYRPKNATEAAALQEYLKTQESELATIEQEIARLYEKRGLIRECYEAHKVFVAPIGTLPPELLQEIFCLSLPDNAGSMHADDVPGCLTRVCRSWRDIAIAKPDLWTQLHISLPSCPTKMDVVKSKAIGVQTWLDRSGSIAPLHLSIYQRPHASADSPYGMGVIFDILRPYAPRWGTLRLSMEVPTAELFVNVPSSELRALRNLHLQLSQPRDQWDSVAPSIVSHAGFLATPTLRTLHFTHVPESFVSYPVDWSQITRLRLDRGGGEVAHIAYLRVFSQMRNLEYLRFNAPWHGSEDDPDLQAFNTIIHLPRLELLAIAEQSPCPKFGELFRCPILTNMEYHETIPHSSPLWRPDGSLAALLAHSGAKVRTLTFDPRLYSKEQILRYLNLCPAIETLIMVEVYRHGPTGIGIIDNDILQAFITPATGFPGGQVTCPRLSSFVHNCAAKFTPSQFLEFLRIKQSGSLEGVAKLDKVVVDFSTLDQGPEGEIRELMKAHSGWARLSYPTGVFSVRVREGMDYKENRWHGFDWEED